MKITATLSYRGFHRGGSAVAINNIIILLDVTAFDCVILSAIIDMCTPLMGWKGGGVVNRADPEVVSWTSKWNFVRTYDYGGQEYDRNHASTIHVHPISVALPLMSIQSTSLYLSCPPNQRL